MRNNIEENYNHIFFWTTLLHQGGELTSVKVNNTIYEHFGSLDSAQWGKTLLKAEDDYIIESKKLFKAEVLFTFPSTRTNKPKKNRLIKSFRIILR